MKKLFILCCVFSIFQLTTVKAVSTNLTTIIPAELIKVHITKIIDGDTFWVQEDTNIYKIRLARADTPETSKRSKTYKDAYTDGTTVEYQVKRGKAVKTWVLDKFLYTNLWLYADTASNKDRYGRTMVYAFLSDKPALSNMVNYILIFNYVAKPSYIDTPVPKAIQDLGLDLKALENRYIIKYLPSIPLNDRIVFINQLNKLYLPIVKQ